MYYATGYGVRVRVTRGHLVVDDGIGTDRRTARFNRATGRLRRLVVSAPTGYIALDAITWMANTGCVLIHLDRSGRVLTTTSASNDHAALRRAQALAASTSVAIDISRDLLAAKLAGQCTVATTLDANAAATIATHQAELADCSDLAALRLVESQAAAVYWAAWRGIHLTFTRRDAARVPDHWTTFQQRVSPLTGSPRGAVDPINAIANFLYTLLEAESRIALTAVGLDPGIGILHTDQAARDSLALDLVEAGRPAVDQYVLDLVAQRTFTAADFAETRNGQCRLAPRLAGELADTALSWAGAVAPRAENTARLLARAAGLAAPPTLLTGDRRRDGRPATDTTKPFQAPRPPRQHTCTDCGKRISTGTKRCSSCHGAANVERLRRLQAAEDARRHETGEHPSRRPEVRTRIAETQRAQWVARREAEPGGFTGTPSEFRRLILPRLAGLTPRYLAWETGLSPGYCAQIRDGKRVPHVRHWGAFQLAGLVT